jgi:hypothetical protein
MKLPASVFTYFADRSVNDGLALRIERHGGMLELAQAAALKLRIGLQ